MYHVKPITRVTRPALGETTLLEQMILTLFTIFFGEWDNFPSVIQNLQKFYSKTQ